MHQVTFELETITPLFMAGAYGKTPELRPPSFKGMLRFWWRAMRADNDIKRLQEDEAKIFGGTGSGQGKSKILIIISHNQNLRIGKDFLDEIDFRKGDKRITKPEYEGLGYLLYSTYTLKDKGNPVLRAFVLDGQRFMVTLKGATKPAILQAIASLWLSLYFGGIGSRSRRGAGNLTVCNLESTISELEELRKIFCIENDIVSFIKAGFSWAKEIIYKKDIAEKRGVVEYSNLIKPRIFVGSQHISTKWKKALNNIGTIYKNYRTGIKNELFVGPNYGIPVMHNRFKTRLVSYQKRKLLSERRSSPIIIKLVKQNDNYIPILIKLDGNLLPNNAFIMKEDKQGNWLPSDQQKKENLKKVDDFLDKLTTQKFTEIKL